MTAEIAILNKVGVALAADSAMTISSRQGDPKVYNSADKLFQLTGGEPVGIMVHGSAEFMGIPAETIVKGFAASSYNGPQETLGGYMGRFQAYMLEELEVGRNTRIVRLSSIVVDVLSKIKAEAEGDYGVLVSGIDSQVPKPAVFVAGQVQKIVARYSEALREAPRDMGVREEHLPAELPHIVGEAISTVLGDGMLEKSGAILELVTLMILTGVDLGGQIGFVFAGFGTKQMFPAISSFECDLAFDGALRIRSGEDAVISAEQVAVISPFAQSEMVDRFMDGVDAGYNSFVNEMVRHALNDFGNEVVRRFGCHDHPRFVEIDDGLSDLRDVFVAELDKMAAHYRASAYRQKVFDVVQFMPKAELAEMAESLVNLTSIKRRVTAEHETVGGPIDVAFVSKHDGFTWVRRKGASGRLPEDATEGVGR